LLDKVFGRTQCYKISGQAIVKKFGIQSEPDYYVRKGNKIFLFEVKGSMIKGAVKQSFSFTEIESELKAKYFYDPVNKENKAILQLKDRIKTLLTGNAKYDEKANNKSIRIYPILLVTELALSTPTVNFILNKWFRKAIMDDTFLKTKLVQIRDLVIVDMNTLIEYSEKFEKNNALFEKTIIEYYASVAERKVRPLKGVPFDPNFIKSVMRKSFIPFGDFLQEKIKITAPDIFKEFGREILPD